MGRVERLVLLTNIPTPYRAAFLDTLSDELGHAGIELRVAYCALTEPNRTWSVDLQRQRFPWKVLGGVHQ